MDGVSVFKILVLLALGYTAARFFPQPGNAIGLP